MKDYINIGPAACARSSSKLILYSFKSGKQALAFFFQYFPDLPQIISLTDFGYLSDILRGFGGIGWEVWGVICHRIVGGSVNSLALMK